MKGSQWRYIDIIYLCTFDVVVKGKVGLRSHPHLFEACLMEKGGLACHDIFGHPTMKMHNLTYGLFEIGDRSWIEFSTINTIIIMAVYI